MPSTGTHSATGVASIVGLLRSSTESMPTAIHIGLCSTRVQTAAQASQSRTGLGGPPGSVCST